MIVVHRPATPSDAGRLFELRRKSIIALAPNGMPGPEVESWAANLTLVGMEAKIREMEVWVAEIDDRVVAWGAIRGDRLEGLYTEPGFANQGIGTGLLAKLEARMRERGVRQVLADASSNAMAFYLSRGYQLAGPPNGEARPIIKHLG